MKTALISLLTAVLLGLASVAGGRLFDAADFVAIAFATGLVAWTVTQYSTGPRPLTKARCIHLPIKTRIASSAQPAIQQAA